MRIELLPLFLGILVALTGGVMILDGTGDPERGPMRERRRRIRASIDRRGEVMVGIGTFLLGIALVGRDSWRFGTLSVLVGTLLVIWGAIRNRHYFADFFFFRGAARRRRGEGERPTDTPDPPLRIR